MAVVLLMTYLCLVLQTIVASLLPYLCLARHQRGKRETHARRTRGTREASQAQAGQKQVTCEAHARQQRGTLVATKQTLAEWAFGPLTLHTLAEGPSGP